MVEHQNTLNGIKEGHIFGTVVQNPYKFGYESVRVMASLARGDESVLEDFPENRKMYIPHRIYKKDNVDEIIAEVNGYLGR